MEAVIVSALMVWVYLSKQHNAKRQGTNESRATSLNWKRDQQKRLSRTTNMVADKDPPIHSIMQSAKIHDRSEPRNRKFYHSEIIM